MQKNFPFWRLPFDVRAIIYTYLEPRDIPPSAAYLADYLANFKSTFEKSTGLKPHIAAVPENSTFAQLRNVTVALPFTSFGPLSSACQHVAWKREVLMALHPLLNRFFHTVRIHFCGKENQPLSVTLLDRGIVEVAMHSLLRDVTYMIERVNRKKVEGQQNSAPCLDGILAGRRDEAYPSARVNAKRICLSWDLREDRVYDDDETFTLNGKLHRIPMSDIEIDDQERKPHVFYHLRDEQRLVGEMGVVSATRWTIEGDMEFNRLLNGLETRVEYCSSNALGKRLKEGLVGISEREFDECDEEVGKVVYGRKFISERPKRQERRGRRVELKDEKRRAE